MAFAPQARLNIPLPMHHPYRDAQSSSTVPPVPHRRQAAQKFAADLSQCLCDFVIQLLPTQEELAVKEDVRKLLERLIRTIEPHSRLLSFGSTANGFSLRNSDMDLCCLIDSEERLAASDLVTMLGDLLERETKFHVKPLPHARIPIVKLSLDPSPGLPLGIACDIGFENRLALENTRLLMCYAMVDPARVRTIVLFLKVWSKRRKINSPYKGTLSSYGYVLLVIYFLVHVKNPPVLPNLQQVPPLRPISKEDTHLNGHNIWFFDDIDLLRQRWRSENTDSVGELLIDFFRYYSREFPYNTGVASIRAGLLKKESKGWQNELSGSRFNDARERNRLCIEDPFEVDYNVARCVSRDGLYTIRGEFMRAFRILVQRPERAVVALAELCEERKGEELVSAPSYHSKPPTLPPQTPYTVGNQTLRPKVEERFSPPAQFFEPGQPSAILQPVAIRSPPEHMAPKRGKWTSPPPPEASPADHKLFENQLGMGLQLATSSTEAREKEAASESNSEVFTDEGSDVPDDDIKSVQSYTEGSSPTHPGPLRRPSWHTPHETMRPPTAPNNHLLINSSQPSTSSSGRGRFARSSDKIGPMRPSTQEEHARRTSGFPPRPTKHHSLPPDSSVANHITPSPSSSISSSSSPIINNRFPFPPIDPANVYYQATPLATALRAIRHVQPSSLVYPRQLSSSPSSVKSGSQHSHSTASSLAAHFHSLQTQDRSLPDSVWQRQSPSERNHSEMGNIKAPVPRDIIPANLPPSLTGLNLRYAGETRMLSFESPDTPTPATFHKNQQIQQLQGDPSISSHARWNSVQGKTAVSSTRGSPGSSISPQQGIVQPEQQRSTQSSQENADVHISFVTSTTTPLNSGQPNANRAPSPVASSPEIKPSQSHRVEALPDPSLKLAAVSSQSSRASASSSSSPTRSSTGGYSTGVSRSPSPSSPSPPSTASPRTTRQVRNIDRHSYEGGEEYGPIELTTSDSVSTIRAERRDGDGTLHSRNSSQR